MKTSIISKQAYQEAHGPITNGRISEESLALFEKIRKLAITDYLVLEPEKGDNLDRLRTHSYTHMTALSRKFQVNFKVRFALRKREGHVVIWKESKPAPSTRNGA